MREEAKGKAKTGARQRASVANNRLSLLWSALAALTLLLAAWAIAARLATGPQADGLLMLAAVCASGLLALRLLFRSPASPRPVTAPAGNEQSEEFESAGSMETAEDPDREFDYVNRAGELYRQQEILLNSVADGICGVDRHGLVSFANPAAGRLLGAPAASLTGKPVHELLHGSRQPGRNAAGRIATSAAVGAACGRDRPRTPSSAWTAAPLPAEYF